MGGKVKACTRRWGLPSYVGKRYRMWAVHFIPTVHGTMHIHVAHYIYMARSSRRATWRDACPQLHRKGVVAVPTRVESIGARQSRSQLTVHVMAYKGHNSHIPRNKSVALARDTNEGPPRGYYWGSGSGLMESTSIK